MIKLIACLLLVSVLINPNASLRKDGQHIEGIPAGAASERDELRGENIIVNLRRKNKKAVYKKIGEFRVPDGFETLEEDMDIHSDARESEWLLKPMQGYADVRYIAVCGCADSAEVRLETVREYLTAVTNPETGEVTYSELITAASPKRGIVFHGYIWESTERDEYTGMFNRYFATFLPGNETGSCIMALGIGESARQEELPAGEVLVEVVGKVVDGIITREQTDGREDG